MKQLIIDPGHGGTDSGGTYGGYLEKDLNLIIAKRLQVLLKEYVPDITRTTDVTLDPGPRTELIRNRYEYCLSIHFNMNAENRIEGIHSIFSTKGKLLAEQITNALRNSFGLPVRVFSRENNGADYYFMHRNTGKTVTVIVECLPLDTQHMNLQMEVISQAIATGFERYLSGQQIYKTAIYEKIAETDICWVDPMALRFAKINSSGKSLLGKYRNFTNGMFFGDVDGQVLTVGTGYSQGILITKRLAWDNKPRGTFIVHINGSVEVGKFADPDMDRKDIWFCVQGIGLDPIDLTSESWLADVDRVTTRMMLGYCPQKKMAAITMRPASDIYRGDQTLKNLGCVDNNGNPLGIGLDSGTPATMVQNGNVLRLAEYLDNIVYW